MTESSTMTTETVVGNNNNDLEAAVVVAAPFAARSDTTTTTTETVTVGGNNNDNAETAVAVPFAARSVTTPTEANEHEHEKQAVFVSVSDNNNMVCHPDVTVTNNQTPGPDPDHARRGNTKRCRGGSCGMGMCFCLVVAFALLVALGILTTLGFPRQSRHEVEQTYNSYSNLDSGTGYPVWSDDGTAIAGVDKYWNNGIIFPPLEGRWSGRVNPRFRVIVVGVVDNDNSNEDADVTVTVTTTTVDAEEPATLLTEVTQHASSLYYMKRAGYVLVNYVSGFQASLLVPIDDSGNKNGRTQSTEYLSNIGLFGSSSAIYTAIPSRDGATIAAISWSEHSRASEVDYFAYNIDFKVAFIDAVTMETIIGGGEGEQEAGQPVISFRAVVAMYSPTEPHSTHWPFFYWEEDQDQVVDVDSSTGMNNGTTGSITNSTSDTSTLTSTSETQTQPHCLLFHMTDLVDFSIALHSDGSGTVQDVDVPTCVPFPTSSGPVRRELDNARAVVDEAGERMEVVANWELEDPYCY
jgi:hypothetical protein